MRFSKAILAMAISSAAVAAWAGPGFGPGLFGGDEGEPRGGKHHRHYHEHRHDAHGGHGHRAGAMSPERIDARIDRMAERLLSSVDGTPEQKQRVSEIAKAAARDMRELRKQGGDLRRQGMALLNAPTIDRAAIESLRTQQMSVADALSKRMSTAFADAAEVLTPEQRAKLAERMQSRRDGKRG